MKLKSVQLVQ